MRAITLARKCSPEAVQLICSCMRDETQPMALRIKCAEVILNKAIPNSVVESTAAATLNAETGIRTLRIEFVKPDGSISETPPVIDHDTPKPNGPDPGTFGISFAKPE